MYKPMTLLALLLAGFLTACGGSDDGSVVQGGDGADTGDGAGSEDVTTDTDIESPRLGNGLGSSFSAGVLEATVTQLSAGGSTQIKANIVDPENGNRKIVSQSYFVEFSSGCAGADPAQAAFSKTELVTSSGEASVTYEARGCSGSDTVTFRLYAVSEDGEKTGSALHAATVQLDIEPPEVGAINFASAEPNAISVSNIANASLPKFSQITFIVVDNNNNPIAGKTVNFELTNNAGGISLSLNSGVTNESGEVVATIRSGTTHAVTSVKATTTANDGSTIGTESSPVSVTTGLPREDRFSLSVSVFNPGAFNVDNVEVEVTASASDAFGNPVPDGTVFNFAAESGRIGSRCTTENESGSCSVTWSSSGDRPSADAVHPTLRTVNERIGMTTIVAYSLGESGFTDQNANYVFDVSPNVEPFTSYAEAFLDSNNNGQLDRDQSGQPVEQFFDLDLNRAFTAAPGVYQGTQCSDAAKGLGHCPPGLVHVREQARIMQSVANSIDMRLFTRSGTTYTEVDPENISLAALTPQVFYVVVQDANENIPESGSTFSANGDGYDIFGDSGEVANSVGVLDEPGTSGLPPYGQLYRVTYDADPEATDRKIELVATSGSGASRTIRLQ
jgi:hypothetical protein